MHILVTGATGRQGGAAARHLLRDGHAVRALTRDPEKPAASALAEAGAEVVRGDMEDRASLDAAVAGVEGVFSVQNYWEKGVGAEGEIRQGRNLADAAHAAGVRHFVQASVAGADQAPEVEHFACKAVIEQHVEASGLPYTFLEEVFYMDNFLDPKFAPLLFPILAGSLGQDRPFHMLATEDIGGIVARVFAEPERFVGQRVRVAGDALTVNEMRAAYTRVTGRTGKGWKLPAFAMRLISAEMARQLRWNRESGWHFDPAETRAVYPEATTFEAFLRRHAAELPRL